MEEKKPNYMNNKIVNRENFLYLFVYMFVFWWTCPDQSTWSHFSHQCIVNQNNQSPEYPDEQKREPAARTPVRLPAQQNINF